MTYDNTDTNADGTLDAEVDNSLIDTANGELKGDVDAKNNDVNNVGALEASENASFRDAIAIHLDPSNGSDSNDGLSSANPVATLQGAIDTIPRMGLNPSEVVPVSIEIADGAVLNPDSTVTIGATYHLLIRLRSQSGSYTIKSSETTNSAIRVDGCGLAIKDATVEASNPSNPYKQALRIRRGFANIQDSTIIKHGDGIVVSVENGSHAKMRGTVIGRNQNQIGVSSYANSSVTGLTGTIKNCLIGINADRGGVVASSGRVDDCSEGIRSQDHAAVKQVAGEVTNCDTAFNPQDGGFIKQRNSPNFTGTTNKFPDIYLGTFIDLDDGKHTFQGWRIAAQNTVTVTAGGTYRVPVDDNPDSITNITWAYASNPSDDATVNIFKRYESGDNVGRYNFEETLGYTDIDIEYIVWEWVGSDTNY